MTEPPTVEPDERYERIPWEQLMPAAEPQRRRWLLAGGAAVVAVAVVGFLLGSQDSAPAGDAVPTAAPPVPTPTTAAPATAEVVPTPLPSEADLRAPSVAGSAGLVEGLRRHLAETFGAPNVWVDQVTVHERPDGAFDAVVSALELADGGYAPVPPIGLTVRARADGGGIVIESIEPASVPPVREPAPAGEVADVPEPVGQALATALGPWPGATIMRVGSDAGRWWAEVAVPLPGGGAHPVVIWPDLEVGLGTGG